MTYPLKFRQHVLELRKKERLTRTEMAKRFGVSMASVMRWEKTLQPKLTRNRPSQIDMQALAQDVQAYPDAYQYERAKRFGMSTRGMCDALRRLGVKRKKNTQSS